MAPFDSRVTLEGWRYAVRPLYGRWTVICWDPDGTEAGDFHPEENTDESACKLRDKLWTAQMACEGN